MPQMAQARRNVDEYNGGGVESRKSGRVIRGVVKRLGVLTVSPMGLFRVHDSIERRVPCSWDTYLKEVPGLVLICRDRPKVKKPKVSEDRR